MAIFKTVNRLELIEEKPFSDEKEIHELTENNLRRFFRLNLVKSEFAVGRYRFDTLAFDNGKRSFVIIEYKKGEDHKARDQASAYLAVMKEKSNHRYIIEQYNKCKNENLGIDDVDWLKSKVILISTAFNKYQREAGNLEDSRIELWQIKRSETMCYEKIQEPVVFDPIEQEPPEDETGTKPTGEVAGTLMSGDDPLDSAFEEYDVPVVEAQINTDQKEACRHMQRLDEDSMDKGSMGELEKLKKSKWYKSLDNEGRNAFDDRVKGYADKFDKETVKAKQAKKDQEKEVTEKEVTEQSYKDKYYMLKFVMRSMVNRYSDRVTISDMLRQAYFDEADRFVEIPHKGHEMFHTRRFIASVGFKFIDNGITLLIAPGAPPMKEVVARDNLFSGGFREYLVSLPGAEVKREGKYLKFSSGGLVLTSIAIPYEILEEIGFYDAVPKIAPPQ